VFYKLLIFYRKLKIRSGFEKLAMAFLFCITVFVSIINNYCYPEPETPATAAVLVCSPLSAFAHSCVADCVKRLKNTAFILNMFLCLTKTVYLIFLLDNL